MNPDPRIEVLLEVSQGQLLHSALFLLRGLPQTRILPFVILPFVILPFVCSTFWSFYLLLFYLMIVLPFVILPFVILPFVILPFVILPFVLEPFFFKLRRAHNRLGVQKNKGKNYYSGFYHFENTGLFLVFRLWIQKMFPRAGMINQNKLDVFWVSCKLSRVFNIIPSSTKTVQFIKQSGKFKSCILYWTSFSKN